MTPPKNTDHAAPEADLRDARLAQALKHMPDAHLQPSAQTRHAVLQAALRAAPASPAHTPPTKRPWWNVWLGHPDQRVPWSAALASVAVLGFITVLWYGQEVPPAKSESGPIVQREEATEKSAAPAASMGADTAAMQSAAPDQERTVPAEVVAQSSQDAEPPSAARGAAVPKPETAPSAAPAAPAAPAPADVSAAADERMKSMSEAAPQRLNRPDIAGHAAKKARDESPAPAVFTVVIGDVERSIAPEQAQKLLKLLRQLSIGPRSEMATRSDTQADFIVEGVGHERWLVWQDRIRHETQGAPTKDSPADVPARASRSDITPTQYEALRRLAMEAAALPLP